MTAQQIVDALNDLWLELETEGDDLELRLAIATLEWQLEAEDVVTDVDVDGVIYIVH